MLKRPLHTACAPVLLLAPAAAVIAQPAPNDATVVSDVQVKAPEQVPVPNVGVGAPLFTVGEIEAMQMQARRDAQVALTAARQCSGPLPRDMRNPGPYYLEYDAAVEMRGSAEAGATATLAAEQIRREAARGLRSQKEVEDAELARQTAVRGLVFARAALIETQAVTADLQKLEQERPKLWCRPSPAGRPISNRQRDSGISDRPACPPDISPASISPTMYPTSEEWLFANQGYILDRVKARQYVAGQRVRPLPPAFADLALENLVVREQEEGAALVVTGSIKNPRTRQITAPPLSFTVLDRFGFPLGVELADPARGVRIAAGRSVPFRYEIRPRPGATDTVIVTFGDDEYEPWRLPAAAVGDCPKLPFDLPKPTEGVLPSPRDLPATAVRPQR